MSEAVETPELKLNFGCGHQKMEGYLNCDLYSDDPDLRIDLVSLPYPWKDGEISEIHASHFVEHIKQELRWPFYEECYRILKTGGVMRITVPSFKSERAYGDMGHFFPPVVPMSFFYLNKGWRDANKLTHGSYALKCDFDHQCGPAGISPAFSVRAHEAQVYACTHYWESFQDVWATLTKR